MYPQINPQPPAQHHQPRERKQRMKSRNTKREGAASTNKNALALLLKPADPTPSNWSLSLTTDEGKLHIVRFTRFKTWHEHIQKLFAKYIYMYIYIYTFLHHQVADFDIEHKFSPHLPLVFLTLEVATSESKQSKCKLVARTNDGLDLLGRHKKQRYNHPGDCWLL